MSKRGLGIDVLTAARQRIAYVFDHFDRICVSFSGGKDSTVMLHLVAQEAARRQARFGVMFIDWEAQYRISRLRTFSSTPCSTKPRTTTEIRSQYI